MPVERLENEIDDLRDEALLAEAGEVHGADSSRSAASSLKISSFILRLSPDLSIYRNRPAA